MSRLAALDRDHPLLQEDHGVDYEAEAAARTSPSTTHRRYLTDRKNPKRWVLGVGQAVCCVGLWMYKFLGRLLGMDCLNVDVEN